MSNFWETVEERRKSLKVSRAELARRAGISESTITYGLKRRTKPLPTIHRAVEQVLEAEAVEQAA